MSPMDITILASNVYVTRDSRHLLELEIEDAELGSAINSPEGWDQVDLAKYLDYKRLELKET